MFRQTKSLTRRSVLRVATITLFAVSSSVLFGQALPTATGPGMYLALGGEYSLFEGDYGKQKIRGAAVYVDANPYRRYGVEAEIRQLRYSDFGGMNQVTYLAGPRVSFRSYGFVPYVKMLAGVGRFNFPYHYGEGNYLALAPGAGLDWNVGRRVRIRLIDVEYQYWPQFTFGALHPYGASVGISYRVFSSGGLGRSRYRRD